MKNLLRAAALLSCAAVPASAQSIGVSIANFDANVLTVLRNGMGDYAQEVGGVSLQIEDAQNDVSKQMNQVQNFAAAGLEAIIVNPVDTDATVALTRIAEEAGIPLVYVNRMPVNIDELPPNQAFVASDEVESGTLQTREVCRLLGGTGTVVVIMGELSNQAARLRTQDIKEVIATEEGSGMTIVDEQTANWQRTQAFDLMSNWITAGLPMDAVIANADEMAIGATQALKAAGKNLDEIVIAGIDGSRDARALMKEGEIEVTVFQDAFGQGRGAIDTTMKILKGEPFKQKTFIPFELITAANVDDYADRN